MSAKHISLVFAVVVALITGCTKSPIEEVKPSEQMVDLELSYVGSTEVKSAIDGTDFPQTGEIGLFLFEDENATKAYGDGYENIKYSYDSGRKKWTASPSIKVGSTPGYLYGYYPCDSGNTDVKAIPVSSSLNGDDAMYASKQVEAITDKTAANTAITMNHALARVSITVKNNGYTGSALLTSIKFEGAKIAGSGTLDATSGNITATKADDVTLSVPEALQTITKKGKVYECLLVPSEVVSGKQDITLTLTIDGQAKTATLSGNDNGVIIAQGTKSNITIGLSNSGLSVQTVSVEDWNVVEVGGHKVMVKFADDIPVTNLLFNVYVEGMFAKIKAYSEGRGLICDISGTANCDRVRDFKDIHTFTISGIQSDITATIQYAHLPPGALKGEFTVAYDGKGNVKRVHFSQGNLYYENETFQFETNQYDFHTYDSDGDTWGLFGWSTKSTKYGMYTSIDASDYSGDFVDWGNAVDDKGTWRTLTKDEWLYLIENHTKKLITVMGKAGYAIIPDSSQAYDILDNYSDQSAWEAAQNAGVLFLPIAGRRNGLSIINVGLQSTYWSSVASSQNNGFSVFIQGSILQPDYSMNRFMGCSVRLVTNAE